MLEMKMNYKVLSAISAAILGLGIAPVSADAKPEQSMTHMKTVAGLASYLEGAGVILYVQGGATAGVIGESISAENSQVVFHVPITGTKDGVQHVGSNLVFFNTATNAQVQLRNPVIDLAKGVVTATIPQASNQSITVLTITNAGEVKPKKAKDRKAGIRSTAYTGAALALAPGVAGTLATLLGLPANALTDGAAFGTADITLKKAIKKS